MNDLPQHRPSPWHPGETALQERAGVAERMALWGQKVIRDFMPDQHRDFYRQLPFILIGTVDKAGRPWASLLEGDPGFVHSPDPRMLMLDHIPSTQDPASAGLGVGAAVGLLGIELPTRRRNRVNGRVAARTGQGFSLEVEHAFGNCPQYIQLRVPEGVAVEPPTPAPAAQHHDGLDPAARALIAAADTFFVASYIDHQDGAMGRAVDVSHRGGQAGFVRVAGDCLTIPDYAGNLHFNTLGNLQLNPRAGLLFIDFASGELLHLSGRTELVFEGPELRAFEGAERLWKLQVETLVRRPAALARRWRFEAYSPASLATGTWAQAEERLRSPWRPLRVVRVEAESATIRSLYLEPEGATAPGPFLAGQHLPLRLEIEGQAAPLIRTYSLSSAPSDELLRISVKQEGLVSSHLHQGVGVGTLLHARAPVGAFVLDPSSRRPLVLLAAGVGITPLLAMLREALAQQAAGEPARHLYLFQSVRRLADLAFREELDELVRRGAGFVHVQRLLSEPESEAVPGSQFDQVGRLSVEHLKRALPFDDYDFYLCGPGGFTQALYDGLRALRIADDRLHAETFGPSTLRRSAPVPGSAPVQPPAATAPVAVVFSRSAKEARWTPQGGSLLELAESRGLNPEFSCRGGSCGTCSTRIVSGAVHYPNSPAEAPAAGHALICCAVPAEPGETPAPLVLDL